MLELNPAGDFENRFQALRTVRVGDLRLTSSAGGKLWLHDLRQDPGQQVDISAEYPEVVEHLRTLLAAPASIDWDRFTEDLDLDDETLRQLEALGYIN